MNTNAQFRFWYGLSVGILLLAFLPLLWLGFFSHPLSTSHVATFLSKLALGVLPFLAAMAVYYTLPFRGLQRATLVFLTLLLAGTCSHVHNIFVDRGHLFPLEAFANNAAWQQFMQEGILRLDPAYLPHTYRFLPHSIVQIFSWFCGDYHFARDVYRIFFYVFLFGFIFRYAILYLKKLNLALVAMLIYAVIYPVTIAYYAGQVIDPVSHLSFIICLYCMASGREAGIGPALLVGIFAKESVAALALCRLFYGDDRKRAVLLTVLYTAASVVLVIAIRTFLLGGAIGYKQISGVSFSHVLTNLSDFGQWGWQYLFTIGGLLPGAILGWGLMDRAFRWTCIFLGGSLIFSNAVFSWLVETRNLVPLLPMLIIINIRYFTMVIDAELQQHLNKLPK